MTERDLDVPRGAVELFPRVERGEPLLTDDVHDAEHPEQPLKRDDEEDEQKRDQGAVRDSKARWQTHSDPRHRAPI